MRNPVQDLIDALRPVKGLGDAAQVSLSELIELAKNADDETKKELLASSDTLRDLFRELMVVIPVIATICDTSVVLAAQHDGDCAVAFAGAKVECLGLASMIGNRVAIYDAVDNGIVLSPDHLKISLQDSLLSVARDVNARRK